MQRTNSFKNLNIIHKALLAGLLIFSGVSYYLLYTRSYQPTMQDQDKVLQIAVLIVAAAGFFMGNFLFKKRILQISNSSNSPQAKFTAYQAACLTQWALLELPALFSLICLLIVGNYAYLALTGLIILVLAMQGPSKQKISIQTGLTEQEIDSL